MPKQMTKAERAEYMRVYRARKKQELVRAGEIMAPRETPVSDTVDTSIAAACVPVPHHWCSTHQQRLVTERQCAAEVDTHGITRDWGIHDNPKRAGSIEAKFTDSVHGYTCGLCPWGRGSTHSHAEFQNHMAHVHPDEFAAGVFERPITPVQPRGKEVVRPIGVIPLPMDVTPEQIAFKRAEYERIKPSFLAAPDDDCAACGHDRQTYHLNTGGVCWAPAPNTRSRRCDCPSYVSAAEPF